jgi:hypothetical protein
MNKGAPYPIIVIDEGAIGKYMQNQPEEMQSKLRMTLRLLRDKMRSKEQYIEPATGVMGNPLTNYQVVDRANIPIPGDLDLLEPKSPGVRANQKTNKLLLPPLDRSGLPVVDEDSPLGRMKKLFTLTHARDFYPDNSHRKNFPQNIWNYIMIVPSIAEVYNHMGGGRRELPAPVRSVENQFYTPKLNSVDDSYLSQRVEGISQGATLSKYLLPNPDAIAGEKPVLTIQEFMQRGPVNPSSIRFEQGKEPSLNAITDIFANLNTNARLINYNKIADNLKSKGVLSEDKIKINDISQYRLRSDQASNLAKSFGFAFGEIFTGEGNEKFLHPRIQSLVQNDYHKKRMESLGLSTNNIVHVLGYLRSLTDTIEDSKIMTQSPQLYQYLTGISEEDQKKNKVSMLPTSAHGLLLAEIMPKLEEIYEQEILNYAFRQAEQYLK